MNYMKKVNKELCLLKEYESVIEDIGSFNIDEIRRLAVDEAVDERRGANLG